MHCIKICADKVPLIREERSMAKDMLSLLEIFISYVSEIVILWYCFSFFLLAVYHQCAYISRVLRTVNCVDHGYGTVSGDS